MTSPTTISSLRTTGSLRTAPTESDAACGTVMIDVNSIDIEHAQVGNLECRAFEVALFGLAVARAASHLADFA